METILIPNFEGTHLFDRLCWAQENLTPKQSDLRCVYEDPATLEEPVKILIAAPEWMACALAGGILPPIESYLDMPLELTLADGRTINTTYTEAQEIRQRENVTGERVLEHHTLHTAKPIGPMTEEEAFEYLIQKDVPKRVWGRSHNRPIMAICTKDQLPQTRKNRNSWKLTDIAA